MTRLMTFTRLGVAMLWAVAMFAAAGVLSVDEASAAGAPGRSNHPVLFKKGGNGNGGQGQGQGHGKDKKDKGAREAEADDAEEISAEEFCNNVDAMVEYLEGKNMNGAIHANENGADNAAAGKLNSCMEHAPNGENAQGEGDTEGDVTVNVDVDDDGNGVIEFDLDGDCVADYEVEAGDGPAEDEEDGAEGDDSTD